MRSCVVAVLSMAPRPEASRLPSDQVPFEVGLLIAAACTAVAAAWKSPVSSAVEPEKPLPDRTSTQQVPNVENGLVPLTVPRSSRSFAETIVAPSGIDEVSNETTVLYWCRVRSSPTRRALVLPALLSSEPPTPEVSDDSSTQPSCAAIDVRVTTASALTTWVAAPLLVANVASPP